MADEQIDTILEAFERFSFSETEESADGQYKASIIDGLFAIARAIDKLATATFEQAQVLRVIQIKRD